MKTAHAARKTGDVTTKSRLVGCVVVLVGMAAGLWGGPSAFAQVPEKVPPYTATAVVVIRTDGPEDEFALWRSEVGLEHFLTAKRVIRKLATELKIHEGLPEGRQAAAGEWQRRWDDIKRRVRAEILDHIPTVSVVAVSYTHEDAEQAARIANMVTDIYREVEEEYFAGAADRRVRVFLDRTKDVERKLAEVEAGIGAFEGGHPQIILWGLDTVRDRQQKLLSDVETAHRRQTEAKVLMDHLEKLRKSLEVWRRRQPPTSRQPVGGVLPDVALEMEFAKAKARYESATKELEQLQTRLSAHARLAATWAADRLRHQALLRQQQELLDIRASLRRRTEEARTAAVLRTARITVVRKAEVPTERDRPVL